MATFGQFASQSDAKRGLAGWQPALRSHGTLSSQIAAALVHARSGAFRDVPLGWTLPLKFVKELKEKKTRLLAQSTEKTSAEHRTHVHKVLFAAYETYLDNVSEIAWLRKPRVASMLRENLFHHDGSKYHLHAYCIMPIHFMYC